MEEERKGSSKSFNALYLIRVECKLRNQLKLLSFCNELYI